MRIPCPYCGERGNEEFSYLGDATLRRPQDGGAAPTPDWESVCLSARQSARAAPRAVVPCRRLPVLAGGDARHARRTRSRRRNRRARSHWRGHDGQSRDPARGRSGAPGAAAGQWRPGRSRPGAALQLRRAQPDRVPGRHAGLRTARERRAAGRAVVQIPPPARHPDRGAGGAERAGRAAHRRAARAEHQGDHSRTVRRLAGDEPEPVSVARISTCWR